LTFDNFPGKPKPFTSIPAKLIHKQYQLRLKKGRGGKRRRRSTVRETKYEKQHTYKTIKA
jgi:hypothetical protein